MNIHQGTTTKTLIARLVIVSAFALLATGAPAADPYVDSWFTTYSARYARIYTSDANKTNSVSATTWSNGTQTQSLPAYSGVQEIYSSSNWVYIRSTGLGIHTMGPWQNGSFPNLPINTKTFWRFPRTNSAPATKTLTGLGAIGYFVDGVAMFDSRDAFFWNGSIDTQGSGDWNRDAYVNESATFDPGYGHQPQDGTHHYHADPIALRYELGDHVDFNPATKSYSESTNPATKHSPILGWVQDGYPVYGPYGYSIATNPASDLRRMISGYVLRNGQYGTSNLMANGRTTIPPWAARLYNVASNILAGPSDFGAYPLGRYMEDNDYLGDLGFTQETNTFDLDEYNGRFCVTPEFPGGTYAYFVSISSHGTPAFPYNIGRAFRGDPAGGAATLTETVTTNFVGGQNVRESLNPPARSGNNIVLTWSAIEGGTYRVEAENDLSVSNWAGIATNTLSGSATGTSIETNGAVNSARYYRVARTALAAYDPVSGTGGGGGGAGFVAPGGSVSRGTGTNITVTITLPTNPPQPPADKVPASVTLAGAIAGTGISRPSPGTVVASFAISAAAPTGARNIVIVFNPAPTYTMMGAFTINP